MIFSIGDTVSDQYGNFGEVVKTSGCYIIVRRKKRNIPYFKRELFNVTAEYKDDLV